MKTDKRQRLPYNYLNNYKDILLDKHDYLFIKGCIRHQKEHFQLNNLQWVAIKQIEQKYFL